MAHIVLIAGNWKMNGGRAQLAELDALARALKGSPPGGPKVVVKVLVCPPATLIMAAGERADGQFFIGGQNCHGAEKGAYTGEISAPMLADAGADYVLVGHSERRKLFGETSSMVREKAAAAMAAGLVAILCVGESEADRAADRHIEVVLAQMEASLPANAKPGALVIAYEPVWAIGTGKTATLADIEQMHVAIRAALAERFGELNADILILYGGSVNGDNSADILRTPQVGGALVGGASLTAAQFLDIIRAAPAYD